MRVVVIFMKTNIKSTNFELIGEIRNYIEIRLTKLDKYFVGNEDNMLAFEIERVRGQKSGNIFRVELVLDIVGGKSLRAEAKGKTWRNAFHEALKKAERELRDLKEVKKRRQK